MTTNTIINPDAFLIESLVRLAINIAVLFIIIRLIYGRYSDKKGNPFAFFLMGIMIFMLCIVLKDVEMKLGMVLGLFAVFSIIRYRTKNMAIRDMAYLFTVIGISAINALLDYPRPVRGTIIVNSIVIITIYLLEISFRKKEKENSDKVEMDKKPGEKEEKEPEDDFLMCKHELLYDKIDLLNPDKLNELIADISVRTGIKVEKIRIRKINLVDGNAELDVFYKDQHQEPETRLRMDL
jgi:hypothetical protein